MDVTELGTAVLVGVRFMLKKDDGTTQEVDAAVSSAIAEVVKKSSEALSKELKAISTWGDDAKCIIHVLLPKDAEKPSSEMVKNALLKQIQDDALKKTVTGFIAHRVGLDQKSETKSSIDLDAVKHKLPVIDGKSLLGQMLTNAAADSKSWWKKKEALEMAKGLVQAEKEDAALKDAKEAEKKAEQSDKALKDKEEEELQSLMRKVSDMVDPQFKDISTAANDGKKLLKDAVTDATNAQGCPEGC